MECGVVTNINAVIDTNYVRNHINDCNKTMFGNYSIHKYNDDGFITYAENNFGRWAKWEYDEFNNVTYEEESYGWWVRKEYDKKGRLLYSEDSRGNITDHKGSMLSVFMYGLVMPSLAIFLLAAAIIGLNEL